MENDGNWKHQTALKKSEGMDDGSEMQRELISSSFDGRKRARCFKGAWTKATLYSYPVSLARWYAASKCFHTWVALSTRLESGNSRPAAQKDPD